MNRIKLKIIENGLTQKNLAEKLKISKATVNSKVNHPEDMRIADIIRFSNILNIHSAQDIYDIFLQEAFQKWNGMPTN